MGAKIYTLIEQDGHEFNPVALHPITEEQAHARYCGKAGKYKKGTISAAWKIANGFSVKKVVEKEVKKEEPSK
mgnify:CR=1 FL=1